MNCILLHLCPVLEESADGLPIVLTVLQKCEVCFMQYIATTLTSIIGWVMMAAHKQAGGPNQDVCFVRKECLVLEDDSTAVQRLDKLRKESGAESIGMSGLQYRLERTLEKCIWVDFQQRPRTSNRPLEVEGASPASASA